MKRILSLSRQLHADSLYRNSIYLMAATAVMAVMGFLFWIINARLFSTEEIGLATTLISVSSLIATFSNLGISNTLVRYLPKARDRNSLINTGLTVIITASSFITVIYLLGLDVFTPKLLFIRDNLSLSVLFIFFMVVTSIGYVTDSIFTAHLVNQFVLIKQTLWSILKLILPVFLISFGAWGIFSALSLATFIAIILSFLILIIKFGYKFRLLIKREVIRQTFKFTFVNYLAGFIGSFPQMFLPILITNYLGPSVTAHYYMPMMIANLLFIIPQAITRSLFAEGSHSENEIRVLSAKATKLNILLLLPAMAITYFLGKYILLVFGREYAIEGTRFLQLLALSSSFYFINSLKGTILNIRKKLRLIFILNIIGSSLILSLSYLFIYQGLTGIGFAWIIAQGLVTGIYLFLI